METKTCLNCEHSSSTDKKEMFRKCIRVGNYTDIEMRFGGRCAEPKTGVPQMSLWEPRGILEPRRPRPTIWMRIKAAMLPTSSLANPDEPAPQEHDALADVKIDEKGPK